MGGHGLYKEDGGTMNKVWGIGVEGRRSPYQLLRLEDGEKRDLCDL